VASELTKAELRTLETILAHGGRVRVTMGRLKDPASVRKLTVQRLEARGLVRTWLAGGRLNFSDVEARAAGCMAVHRAHQAQAFQQLLDDAAK
jgi:hypothetical protein